MKISKIEFKNYQQFKDIQFDFTYPKGHKDAGKPLNKICFIGQSGTGKTTILRLIKYFVSRNKILGHNFQFTAPEKNKIYFEMQHGDLFSRKTVDSQSFWVDSYKSKGRAIKFDEWKKLSKEYEEKRKPLLINYPAEVIRGNNPSITDENSESKQKKINEKLDFIEKLEPQKIVDFAVENIENIRNFVLKEIKEHRANEILYKNKISEIILNEKTTPADIKRINKQYEQWHKKNTNPLNKLAEECLDPILNKFGLKVKTQIDLDTILALGDIQLQTLEGIDVDRPFWSTGTRHLVDTIVPLFELKPKDAIILMDEPEKSLYPDIQEMIIDFYTNLTPECQFFFATHSPIIASSFDPWEVFQLEYDKSNKNVILVKNYEGEKTIDNYKYYPKYLRWDAILMKIFNLKDEGNDLREESLLEVGILNDELQELIKKGKQNTQAFKSKKEKFIKLAKKIGWDEKNQ